jgi:uncharacterized membrane protein (DUF485 family)
MSRDELLADRGLRRVPQRRVRKSALILTALALAFYFGFIAITIYRSHH